MNENQKSCHDCNAIRGKQHVAGCYWEECPFCRRQMISCNCIYKYFGIDDVNQKDWQWIYYNGPTDKMSTISTTTLSSNSGTIGGVNVTELQVQTGKKQSTSTNSSVTETTLSKDLKNLQQMSIWVPGWNGNRLGMKVKIELPKPIHLNQYEDDESYSGEWVVNKVRDKIMNSYFIQELFVSRAGKI